MNGLAVVALLLIAPVSVAQSSEATPTPAEQAKKERPHPSPPEIRAEREPSALEWLRTNVTRFSVDVPTREELKPLMERLQGARVIGFGEATHGDQQSQLFKTHAIRELARRGQIDSLMVEINRAPGDLFDAYVNEGKGDLASLIMDSGLFSIWKTDEFASLMVWLRGHVLRTGKPFRIYGIDCQEPEEDLLVALRWLERHDRRAARDLRKTLAPLVEVGRTPGAYYTWLQSQKKADYPRFHGAAKRLVEAIEKHKNRPGSEEALYAALVGVQGLEAYEYEFGPAETPSGALPNEYYVRRDVFMARNLMTRLGTGRAAFWAHDMHTVGALHPIGQLAGFRTAGTELRKALGSEYVALGFAWTTGAFRARRIVEGDSITDAQRREFEVFELSCDRPGDLGEFLAKVGADRWYVDLRSAPQPVSQWGELLYYRGWAGAVVDPKTWLTIPMQEAVPVSPLHDILVYHRRIGPSTVWQLPKKPTPDKR